MALPISPITAAEVLEIQDGKIVRGELIFDAEEFRAATAGAKSGP